MKKYFSSFQVLWKHIQVHKFGQLRVCYFISSAIGGCHSMSQPLCGSYYPNQRYAVV